ncbi:MAG: hypothetical protein ACRC62_00695 [Microcoleus sp.]
MTIDNGYQIRVYHHRYCHCECSEAIAKSLVENEEFIKGMDNQNLV